MEDHKRRMSDQSIVGKLSDSVWLNIIHRFSSILAPVLAGIFIAMFNSYSTKLNMVYDLLNTKVAAYDQHFEGLDNQVSRLQDKWDYPDIRRKP